LRGESVTKTTDKQQEMH